MVFFRSTLTVCLLLSATDSIRLDKNKKTAAVHADFSSFVLKHERQYKEGTPEYESRRSIYLKSAADVDDLNHRFEGQWTAEINHLADWTGTELKSLLGHKSAGITPSHGSMEALMEKQPQEYAAEKSWAHLSSIATAVDQMACGSCWAVTTSRLLASHSEIFMGDDARNFSTQEIVDCTLNPQQCGGKGGCDGATVTLGLDYVMRSNNALIKDYPYTGVTGQCKGAHQSSTTLMSNDDILAEGDKTVTGGKYDASAKGPTFGLVGWNRLPMNKEAPLVAAVQRGPVAVSVDGSPWSFYSSGIFTNCKLDSIINHAVLMIGYGVDSSRDVKYWHIQNSWGASWGETGKIRLERHPNEETHCGTDYKPEEGSGCIGGPKEIRVCGSCGILNENAIPYFVGRSTPADTSDGQATAAYDGRGRTRKLIDAWEKRIADV